jgi:hypothetical protein
VDDDVVSALEAAIADLGTLLVQMDKFRAGAAADARDLRAACHANRRPRPAARTSTAALDVAWRRSCSGDRGRRTGSRSRALARGRPQRLPAHTRGVAALAAGDVAGAAQPHVPALFAGVEDVTPPPVLFHPVAGSVAARPLARRRQSPPTSMASGAPRGSRATTTSRRRRRSGGCPASLVGGTAARRARSTSASASAGAARGRSGSSRSRATVVGAGARLVTPFAVGLASPDDEDLDEWTLDPAAYRDALAAAITARGLPLDRTS